MDDETLDPQHVIREVEALLNAAWSTPTDSRHDQLLNWARESLQPLLEANHPEALWLSSAIPKEEAEHISGDEFNRRYIAELRVAAEAGSASAKFSLACELDYDATTRESAELFKSAAEQGHTYSKWCHGLNLLSGRGIEKDVVLGLRYIDEAANEKFQGAIQFLSNAYANGTYGYPKNEEIAAAWWAKLKDKDVLRF